MQVTEDISPNASDPVRIEEPVETETDEWGVHKEQFEWHKSRVVSCLPEEEWRKARRAHVEAIPCNLSCWFSFLFLLVGCLGPSLS